MLIDYSSDGSPIGIEITAPGVVTVDDINRILVSVGLETVAPAELAPLRAA